MSFTNSQQRVSIDVLFRLQKKTRFASSDDIAQLFYRSNKKRSIIINGNRRNWFAIRCTYVITRNGVEAKFYSIYLIVNSGE